jgi:hypothetical protein
MSEETIKRVQELIEKGKGDAERLNGILNSLQNGSLLDLSDQQYIENLFSTTDKFETKEESITSEKPPEPINETNNTTDVTDKTSFKAESKSNRKKIIIAGIVITAIICGFIGTNAYASSTVQIRPHQGNQYAISQTALHIQAEACNPSFFPASFHNYEIIAVYKTKVLEIASINGSTISPKSSMLLDGTFIINKEAVSEFANQSSVFDPKQASVKTKLDAPIFGIIPFAINKEYTGQEFANVVKNGPPGGYQC